MNPTAIESLLRLVLIDWGIFIMVVSMSLVTMAMTGPLLRWSLPDELRPPVPDYAADNARRSKCATQRGELSNVR
jgi:hypothetical protein